MCLHLSGEEKDECFFSSTLRSAMYIAFIGAKIYACEEVCGVRRVRCV